MIIEIEEKELIRLCLECHDVFIIKFDNQRFCISCLKDEEHKEKIKKWFKKIKERK